MLLKLGYSNKTNNPNDSPKRRMFGLFSCGRSDRIRTCGLLVPNQAHYQAVPHPDYLILNLRTLRPELAEGDEAAKRPRNERSEFAHIPSCATPRLLLTKYNTPRSFCQYLFDLENLNTEDFLFFLLTNHKVYAIICRVKKRHAGMCEKFSPHPLIFIRGYGGIGRRARFRF